MSRMQKNLIFLLLILSFTACSQNDKIHDESGKLKTSVSITPMKYLVEQIGKDKIEVSSIIPNGSDPHTFDPSPRTIKQIHDADIYFMVGGTFTFEKNIIDDIKKDDNSKFVDCSKGIELIKNDPHIWLGMEESKIIASNIADKLIEIDTPNKIFYEENLKNYIKKVDSLNAIIADRLSDLSNNLILVYHPAWRYFLTPFNINEESVEKEGKHPKAGDLKEIIKSSNYQNIRAIFIEQQFNPEAAKSIADELEIKVIKINPLTANLLEEWNDFSIKIKENLN